MKNNLKLLASCMVVLPISITPLSTITSCNKQSTDEIFKNEILNEFAWLCTQYRETFMNRQFCMNLAQRIKDFGYNCIYDLEYKPVGVEDAKKPYGFNFYFDIPANTEGYPMIGLQAHTDMVCDTSVEDYDWQKGIETVIEDGKMHSKDYQTSIGADDGIGVATILALAKQPDLFKHGTIRCLFTVDEEDGDSGANAVSPSTFYGIKYLLNLDCEHAHKTGVACGGCLQTTLTTENGAASSAASNCVKIVIDGLLGGHSGHILHENRINGIVLMAKMVNDIISKAPDADVRFISAHEGITPEKNPHSGSIPDHVEVVLGSNQDISSIVSSSFTTILNAELDAHTVENKEEVVKLSGIEVVTSEQKGITAQYTKNLCELFVDSELDGIIEPSTDPEHPDLYSKCINLGTFRIGKDCYPVKSETGVYIETFSRSKTRTDFDLPSGWFMNKFADLTTKHFGTGHNLEWKCIARNAVWPKDDISAGNKLNALIHEAADSLNYEMEDEDILGWLEMGAFAEANPAMHMATLGPELENVHTVREVLYVDTIKPMVNMLLYVLENANKI